MATGTEEIVYELRTEVAVLKKEVALLTAASDAAIDLARQVAVLQSQLAEMTKTRDLWGQRGWAVFTVAVSAAFSLLTGTATAGLAYYLNLKK